MCSFKGSDSWVVLSPIEQSIKRKVEKVGTPLKDWEINIYRGVLTGCNDAFIISGEKKDELIAADPKSAEIIRPILRGRDIKRYKVEFADLWLINCHNGIKDKGIKPIDIHNYPAIKKHLDKYWNEIHIRADQGNTPYNLRNCVYMDDFFKQKIIYPEITKYLNFYYDENSFFTNNKCFILTGHKISFLSAFFNSSLFKYCFRENFPELLGGTRELRKIFIEKLPIIKVDDLTEKQFYQKIKEIQNLKLQKRNTKEIELEIDKMIFNLYKLTEKEQQEIGFIEIQ